MSPEAQRIAIAKACGLKVPDMNLNCDPENQCWPDCTEVFNEALKELPDYLNDLNACYEFEKALSKLGANIQEYNRWLESAWVSNAATPSMLSVDGYSWHATAAQRCEAFRRTLSLWKD